jgi:hypothetical protein
MDELGLGEREPMRLGDTALDVDDFFEGIRLFAEGPMRGVMRFERMGKSVNATLSVDVEFTAALFKEAVIAAGEKGDILIAACCSDEGIKIYIAFSCGIPDYDAQIRLGKYAHLAGFKYYGTTETGYYVEAKIRPKKMYSLYNPRGSEYYCVLDRIFFNPALPPKKYKPVRFS